jgi:hypothetical protein
VVVAETQVTVAGAHGWYGTKRGMERYIYMSDGKHCCELGLVDDD